MNPPFPELVHCPHCQATNPAVEDRCQECGRALAVYIGPAERVPKRFGLGSMMLLIALIAVCLGVAREVPPLGVVLLVVLIPSLARTVGWAARRAADGRPMPALEKIGAFGMSVAVVWLLSLMAGVGFGIAFLVGLFFEAAVVSVGSWFVGGFGRPDWGFYSGLTWGLTGALATLYALGRQLWPIQE